MDSLKPIFDINLSNEDKFLHSILFSNGDIDGITAENNRILNQFKSRCAFNFGFVPFSEPFMPMAMDSRTNDNKMHSERAKRSTPCDQSLKYCKEDNKIK